MIGTKNTPNDVNNVMEAKGMDFYDFEEPRKTCIFCLIRALVWTLGASMTVYSKFYIAILVVFKLI